MKAGGANGEKEMKKIRAHRVSGIVLYAMLAMTVVVAVLFFFGGEVPMAGRVVADVSQSEPRYTDALLCWVYALLGLAVVVALGTALRKQVLGFVNAPGAMVRLWVGAGLLVALLGGAWLQVAANRWKSPDMAARRMSPYSEIARHVSLCDIRVAGRGSVVDCRLGHRKETQVRKDAKIWKRNEGKYPK